MEKKAVRFHSPLVIVVSPKNRFFTGRYDDGYPFQLYHGAYNPLGGSPSVEERDGGKGPRVTLERELQEEINPASADAEPSLSWASKQDIARIRDSILAKLVPEVDAYIHAPDMRSKGGRPEHSWIASLYGAWVDEELIEMAREHIVRNRKILSEGFAGVTDMDSLLSGKDKLAHSSALLFSYLFKQEFPCLIPGATLEVMGKPRQSYQDYQEIDYDPKAFKE